MIDMAPVSAAHASAVSALSMRFARYSPLAFVSTQHPLVMFAHDELYPDIALLQPRSDRYRNKTVISASTASVTVLMKSGAT